MKNFVTKSVFVLAFSCLLTHQANAFVLFVSTVETRHTLSSGQKALLVGIAFLTNPLNGLTMLLDEKSDAYQETAKRLVKAGASQEEAENLSILIVNSALKSGGKDFVIRSEDVEAAAPIFSRSEGFEKLLGANAR